MSYYILKILIRIFSMLPFTMIQGISRCFAFLLHRVFAYRKAVIQDNLSKSFPTKTSKEISQLTKGYYAHLSDLVFETLKGFSMSNEELLAHFQFTNPAIFDPYLEKGQSCILMGSHYNNWELGCLAFPLWIKTPTYGVFKPLSNLSIGTFINTLRAKTGMRLVKMAKIGRTLVQEKANANIYLFVADQGPASTDHAIWINFLNRNTPFLHGVEKIARHTSYPVFYFIIKKVKRGYYELTVKEVGTYSKETNYGDCTTQFADLLNQQISEAPEYWLWSHRRWKRTRD